MNKLKTEELKALKNRYGFDLSISDKEHIICD